MYLPHSVAAQTLNQEENKMKWIPEYSPTTIKNNRVNPQVYWNKPMDLLLNALSNEALTEYTYVFVFYPKAVGNKYNMFTTENIRNGQIPNKIS
jgi:hypothetical protein